jgi:hypothetical protein
VLRHWPLLLVLFTALIVALASTSLRTSYAGWDNIHAEMNLPQYASRVFFGAWQEHQGLGGPAAKGHLAEITRLPILFLFQLLIPQHLFRYSFIFLMYIIGGVTMYSYIYFAWLKERGTNTATMLSAVGGIFYLLHVLTLQQYYISFEMFMVQFAFFPLMLLCVHWLSEKISHTSVLLFLGVQLLLAASAHTPTVFYLGILCSLVYGFALNLSQTRSIIKAFAFTFLVGLFTGLANGFWIVPNLYYSLNNSQYVAESKANVLFGPEAVWSIREASTLPSYLSGLHYLVTWKDYDFARGEHELIFEEWQDHLNLPFTQSQMYILGIASVVGLFLALSDRKKQGHRFAVVALYVLAAIFIWMDLFPTQYLIHPLYENNTFLEAFRNPFTKLSIIYSFFLVVLFVQFLESLILLSKQKVSPKFGKIIATIAIGLSLAAIMRIAEPSFKGQFISEKLKVSYPAVYTELFEFLQNKDPNARVLEMPYLAQEGWVFYDWSTPQRTNGYQGIGFNFFGFPQPYLTPDFARWSETNDFFYQELKQAVNNFSAEHLAEITAKYHVPIIVIDESRISPHTEHSFELDHAFVSKAGFEKIWEKEFVSVYEKTANHMTGSLIVPPSVSITDESARRVKRDVMYSTVGNYISESDREPTLLFPLAELLHEEVTNVDVLSDKVTQITKAVPKGNYTIHLPAHSDQFYTTTMALERENEQVRIFFPEYSLLAGGKKIPIPQLLPQSITLPEENQTNNTVFINQKEFSIENHQRAFVELTLSSESRFIFSGDPIGETELLNYKPDWTTITKETSIPVADVDSLTLQIEFPRAKTDLLTHPSENCAQPTGTGEITTTYNGKSAIYTADFFGVNCNSTNLAFMTPSSSYLMTLAGENSQGRSIKLFVNYAPGESLHEEFLLPEGTFNKTYTLHKITSNLFSQFHINWETRSFGKKSVNQLDELSVLPVPLHRLSYVSLGKQDITGPLQNDITILQNKKRFDFYYKVHLDCHSETCFIGTNEAYDDLWLAYDHSTSRWAPHARYNSWANIWEVSEGETTLTFIYIPQIVAFLGMFVVLASLSYLVPRSLQERTRKKTDRQDKKKRAKNTFRTPKRVLAGIHRKRVI